MKRKYIKAKTIEEAEKYAKEVLKVNPYYKGLKLEIANTCNKCITELFNEFPKTKRIVKVVGNGQTINKDFKAELSKEYEKLIIMEDYNISDKELKKEVQKRVNKLVGKNSGSAMTMKCDYRFPKNTIELICLKYEGLYINTRVMKDINEINANYQRDIENGHAPKTDNTDYVKCIIDHEMGHILDFTYKIHKTINIEEIGKEKIEKEVSKYATNSVHEFVAECWCEYRNSRTPQPLANMVGNKIEKNK